MTKIIDGHSNEQQSLKAVAELPSPLSTLIFDLSEREAAVRADELALEDREKAVALREHAQNIQAGLASRGAFTALQLREANERLIIATVRAQTMSEAAEQATVRMSYMAEHDFLTGLPNRSVLLHRLDQSMELAKRHGKKTALMYMDLDHFKRINDSLGHSVGDQLLQSVAKRLQSCVRSSDTVSRQGGDEFVALLAEIEEGPDAACIAQKLIGAMAEPFVIGGHHLHVSLSIGLSVFPDDGEDIESLVRNADTAMYRAKETGRNNYHRFTLDMNAQAVVRQSTEQALRQALERNEFILHYQPKVNLETGAITGVEALLRWQPEGKPFISPMEFVSIAEDSGLILPIGKWVLGEAARQTVAWLKDGLSVGQMAVNVSAVEFHGKDFLASVRNILTETGIDPRNLELEITESGLMQDTEPTMKLLHALKELGVRIAVDDFGTGYSSLSYLRRFPIDTLKIDQSFVQGIDGDTGKAIVSAIIALGMSLKHRVVAEGIEVQQQLDFLTSRNCVEGQGYLFSRALSVEKFSTLLSSRDLERRNLAPAAARLARLQR